MIEKKFKAWDCVNETMIIPEKLEDDHYIFCFDNNGSPILRCFEMSTNGNNEEYESYINVKADFLQYTGLKDCKGNEIYEGDIVTAHSFLFDGNEVESQILGVIGSNEFGWTLERIKNEFYEIHTGYECGEGASNLGDFYGLHDESFEIIGNKYENLELLEGDA